MKYTLIADGTSDKVFIDILTWTLKQEIASPIESQWADFSRIPRQPDRESSIRAALDLYPCDVLFVHRDAENQPPEERREEIAILLQGTAVPHVPVIPVRMTEAWLLFDESSIRCAAGNPNGSESLDLPDLTRIEELSNPKKVLHDALVRASGLNARRRSRFRVETCVHRITDYIDDYTRLGSLSAFQTLRRDIKLFARERSLDA